MSRRKPEQTRCLKATIYHSKKQKKMIVVFDIETTGLSITQDRIVEISMRKLESTGKLDTLINPGRKIPQEVIAIHGIDDSMVAEAPTFQKMAREIYDFMHDCDLAGHNIKRFDLPFLMEEFNRVGLVFPAWPCKIYDTCEIFRQVMPHTLEGAAAYFLKETYTEGHRAATDTEMTARILVSQLETIDHLDEILQEASKSDVDYAGHLKWNEAGVVIYNLGKVKGKPVTSDRGFASWMLQGDFPSDTKQHLRKILGI